MAEVFSPSRKPLGNATNTILTSPGPEKQLFSNADVSKPKAHHKRSLSCPVAEVNNEGLELLLLPENTEPVEMAGDKLEYTKPTTLKRTLKRTLEPLDIDECTEGVDRPAAKGAKISKVRSREAPDASHDKENQADMRSQLVEYKKRRLEKKCFSPKAGGLLPRSRMGTSTPVARRRQTLDGRSSVTQSTPTRKFGATSARKFGVTPSRKVGGSTPSRRLSSTPSKENSATSKRNDYESAEQKANIISRMNTRQQALNLREGKLADKEKKFSDKEKQTEAKQTKLLEKIKEKRAQLQEAQLEYQADVDRVNNIEAAMAAREQALESGKQKIETQCNEVNQEKALLATAVAAREECEAALRVRQAQTEEREHALGQQEEALTAAQNEVEERGLQLDGRQEQISLQHAQLDKDRGDYQTSVAEQKQMLASLQERLEHQKEALKTAAHSAARVQRQTDADLDTVKQERRLLEEERNHFTQMAVDWQQAKEDLLRENTKLRSEASMVKEEKERLETTKQRIEELRSAAEQEAAETQTRVLAAREEAQRHEAKASELEVLEQQLLASKADMDQRCQRAEEDAARAKQQTDEAEAMRDRVEEEKAAVDKQKLANEEMKMKLEQQSTELAAQTEEVKQNLVLLEATHTQLESEKAATKAGQDEVQEERIRLRKLAKVLAGEEEGLMEMRKEIEDREEAMLELAEQAEQTEQELQRREKMTELREEEVEGKMTKMTQFQAMFDTTGEM